MNRPINQDGSEKERIKIINPSFNTSNTQYEEILVNLENGSQFSGKVINGYPNGQGVEYRKDGAHYSGNFVNGKWQGEGKITTENLNVYQGEFIDGHFCGI